MHNEIKQARASIAALQVVLNRKEEGFTSEEAEEAIRLMGEASKAHNAMKEEEAKTLPEIRLIRALRKEILDCQWRLEAWLNSTPEGRAAIRKARGITLPVFAGGVWNG